MPKPRRKSDIRAAAEVMSASLRSNSAPHTDTHSTSWRARMIEALKGGGSVSAAVRVAGVSRAAAYRARARDAAFAVQWKAALPRPDPAEAFPRWAPRSIPVFWRGVQVGTRLEYDNSALLRALRAATR